MDQKSTNTSNPGSRSGAYSAMTWLCLIFFILSGTTVVSSSGANPVAWLVLGASVALGLLLWWAGSRKRS